MDSDAAPPPIYRSSRETRELQQELEGLRLEDDDSDEAAPPPIRRKRPVSMGAAPSTTFRKPSTPSKTIKKPPAPPLPSKSPMRSNQEPLKPESLKPTPAKSQPRKPESLEQAPLKPEPPKQARRQKNFSHPFKEQFQLRNANPIPYRDPATFRRLSYRSNPRLPPSLRRWSSLETIESVTTAPSILEDSPRDEPDYPVSEGASLRSGRSLQSSRSQRLFLFDDDDDDNDEGDEPVPYKTQSESSGARSSDSGSLRSPSIPTRSSSSPKHSASSVLRRLKPSKPQEPLLLPEHLEIQKRVSIDQHSQRTNSSSSTMTISSGRPSDFGYPPSSAGSVSYKSTKDWKSSSYDVSNLTEAELKKCKKKGINPALYAEMKAARKGKFVSPIGGNTFL